MNNKDGGPAFPTALIPGSAAGRATGGLEGMSLRDYFAGQVLGAFSVEALKALTTNTGSWISEAADELGCDTDTFIVDSCYDLADKMIEARELDQ